jgi:hypothetical protein
MTPIPIPIGEGLPTPIYTVVAIQDAFRRAKAVVPKPDRAQKIADALPLASVATGRTQGWVLRTCIQNRMGGAVERIIAMQRGRDIEMARRAARATLIQQRADLR